MQNYDDSKYLTSFCITLFIALIVLIIAGVLIFKQRRLFRFDSCVSTISEENRENNHANVPKGENANNWNRYYNNVGPAEEDISLKNEMITNDEPCLTIPFNPFVEKSCKNLSYESVNQGSALPYKNNLHKELNVMAFKDCFQELEIIV